MDLPVGLLIGRPGRPDEPPLQFLGDRRIHIDRTEVNIDRGVTAFRVDGGAEGLNGSTGDRAVRVGAGGVQAGPGEAVNQPHATNAEGEALRLGDDPAPDLPVAEHHLQLLLGLDVSLQQACRRGRRRVAQLELVEAAHRPQGYRLDDEHSVRQAGS